MIVSSGMNGITELSAAIELAHEPDFRLGVLLVSPSACRVEVAGEERRIEPRVMEVLVRMTRSLNQTVTRDELIAACWGGRFIGDDAVSRVIYQLRNLARDIEPAPFALETVPKVGFRLVASDGETAPADVTEVARQAAAQTSDPGRASFGTPRTAAGWALAAVLVLILAAVGAWSVSQVLRIAAQNGRVEVALFEPLQQNDPGLRRYAEGVSEAVVRTLISNGVKTTRRVAEGPRSNAEFKVMGTVDHSGPGYMINAQVLDRRTGDVLWSRRFDRRAEEALEFQEEAANRIADTLDCAIWHRTAGRKRMTAELFSLFLNACVAGHETFWDARPFMEVTGRLVQAAPNYSYAHSLHAMALAVVASDPLTSEADNRSLSRGAEAEARRALQLEPRNGEAYLALGSRFGGPGHWLERERNFVRAAELSPTLRFVRSRYIGVLREVGWWDEALAMNRRTIADDPFSTGQLSSLVLLRAAAGDPVEAEALSKRLDRLDPQVGRRLRYTTTFWWGEPGQARAQLRLYADPDDPATLACHEAYLERLDRAAGAPLRGLPAQCVVQTDWRVRMLARQGDIDGAYAVLAAEARPPTNSTLFFYPEMKAFRRDPRFMPLARGLGLVDYWVKSDHWPDFCAEPDLPYDCRALARRLTSASV